MRLLKNYSVILLVISIVITSLGFVLKSEIRSDLFYDNPKTFFMKQNYKDINVFSLSDWSMLRLLDIKSLVSDSTKKGYVEPDAYLLVFDHIRTERTMDFYMIIDNPHYGNESNYSSGWVANIVYTLPEDNEKAIRYYPNEINPIRSIEFVKIQDFIKGYLNRNE